MVTRISSIEEQIQFLHQKVDRLMVILENNNKNDKIFEKKWTIENYKESIIVKFPFNNALKDFIKDIGGKWLMNKGWMFPKSKEAFVVESITDNFGDWTYERINN
jgi:hypothetical protein